MVDLGIVLHWVPRLSLAREHGIAAYYEVSTRRAALLSYFS